MVHEHTPSCSGNCDSLLSRLSGRVPDPGLTRVAALRQSARPPATFPTRARRTIQQVNWQMEAAQD
jgi:hypothetical protein